MKNHLHEKMHGKMHKERMQKMMKQCEKHKEKEECLKMMKKATLATLAETQQTQFDYDGMGLKACSFLFESQMVILSCIKQVAELQAAGSSPFETAVVICGMYTLPKNPQKQLDFESKIIGTFRNPVETACGILQPNNVEMCSEDARNLQIEINEGQPMSDLSISILTCNKFDGRTISNNQSDVKACVDGIWATRNK